MNDDLVQPARGFGTHGHGDMEICTYIVQGNLTHKDSMGTAETLSRGAIQFMTAGTGVSHSEHNLNATDPLRFIQMWLLPRTRGLPPNYGSGTLQPEARHNAFAHLVADVRAKDTTNAPVYINQDANIFVSEFDEGKSVEFEVKADRQAYILCVESKGQEGVKVEENGKFFANLVQHDAGEAFGPVKLNFTGSGGGGHVLIVEMGKEAGIKSGTEM